MSPMRASSQMVTLTGNRRYFGGLHATERPERPEHQNVRLEIRSFGKRREG